MILKLVTVPDLRLREKSVPVKILNNKNIQFIRDLANTLVKKENPSGVGLSAVQVGTNVRIFVTLLPPVLDFDKFTDELPPSELKVFINPEIIDASEEMTYGPDAKKPALEGCLSIPALYGPVSRYKTFKLRYQTIDHKFLEPHTKDAEINTVEDVFSNFFARVVQHEYDHLDGILFTDYTKKEGSDLYFDNNDQLIPIPKPKELIMW